MIDLDILSKRLEGRKEIGLLSTTEYKDMIKPVYDYIRRNHPLVNVFLLNGEGILCPLKTEEFDFFILLGISCPIHQFKDFICIHNEISVDDHIKRGEESRVVVYDSSYDSSVVNEEELVDKDILVVSKNQMLYDYYFYKYGAESLYGLERKDRMGYLTSMCNKGMKIRDLQIFAVIFTSRMYEDLARSIRRELKSRHKNAYLLFLKEISYERMITIEGTECIVVVDCPLFDFSHIELHIPVVSPFEVEYALSNEWKRFDRNSFSVSEIQSSECTEIDLLGRVGGLLLKSEFQGVPFCYEEEDVEIHAGQSGVSYKYESEG